VPSSPSTPPSITVTKSVACRRRYNKHRNNRKHVTTKRSIDWKLVDFVFEPLYARFNFTLEGCVDDEGLNSHGDLPLCSLSDSILERDLRGERVSFNPPRELGDGIHIFTSFRELSATRRATPTSTLAIFVLPKWVEFSDLTRQWIMYQEVLAMTHLFTRELVDDPT
jgi:hypothetical protein